MQFQFYKNARTLAVALLLTTVIFSLCACGTKLRYGTWKDTHEVYGDGEYQLMTDPDHSYSLYNNAIRQTILSDVSLYKNVGKTAYFYGESPISREERVRLFAVLHTESNELCYVLDEASVPSDHRELLEDYVGRRFSDIAVTVLDLPELNAEEQSILLSLRENAVNTGTETMPLS